uniref:Uncharacterized protein n=1 Tax=Romanomermis culicivorax TaxID=13658 RepID=A0A915ITJ1_ROMCU
MSDSQVSDSQVSNSQVTEFPNCLSGQRRFYWRFQGTLIRREKWGWANYSKGREEDERRGKLPNVQPHNAQD